MNITERDQVFEKNVLSSRVWLKYFLAVGRFLLEFFVVMLAVELYLFYFHKGQPWQIPETIIALLAFFSIACGFAQMLRKLPMGVFMLAMPIVPLCMLIIVLTSFPILHYLEKQFQTHGILPPPISLSH